MNADNTANLKILIEKLAQNNEYKTWLNVPILALGACAYYTDVFG
jgi:hypothetical protein